MKVGIFDPYLDSVSGGEKYMLTAASYLSKSHEVYVFWDKNQEDSIRKKATDRFNLDLSKVIFTENIFSKNTSFITRFFKSRSYQKIFYLSDGSIPFLGTSLYIHFQFPVEWVKATLITKMKVQNAKKVVCNSFFTKSFIDKKFYTDSAILYPPADVEGIADTEKDSIILHVGRFGETLEGENYKKQDIMIEVFKQLVQAGLAAWQLVMIISYREEDREKVAKLKELADGFPIKIIENANYQTVKEYYDKSKIYWHATGFGEDLMLHPERAEHFGISTVEAMAHKCVPVVINAGGQKEIVEDGKNGFLWNTKEELAEKTSQLIKDPDLMKSLGEEASFTASQFSVSKFCKELSTILEA